MRSVFGSSASATAVGKSRERGETGGGAKPTTPGAGIDGIFAIAGMLLAVRTSPDAATLRAMFGSTVLLKRSLLGFVAGTAMGREAKLSAEAGNRRALVRLKRWRKGIVMR